MYKFSKKSLEKLETCHPELRLIMNKAIQYSKIDFGISEGHRSLERQNQLFKEGKTTIDGINKLGKHNSTPSMAVDIYAFVNGKANYEEKYLCYIAGIIQGISESLLTVGTVSHSIRWGGNWDGDGIIKDDQNFNDMPHFELKKMP